MKRILGRVGVGSGGDGKLMASFELTETMAMKWFYSEMSYSTSSVIFSTLFEPSLLIASEYVDLYNITIFPQIQPRSRTKLMST